MGQGGTLGPPSGTGNSQAGQGSPGLGFGPSITQGLDHNHGFSGTQTAQQSMLANLDMTFIQGDVIVARVGADVILLSEVFPQLHLLHRNPEAINEQTLQQVRQAVQQTLPSLITSRLIIQDFERTVPEEAHEPARKQFVDYFEGTMIPQIMEQAEAPTRAKLIEKLKENGLSLDQIRRTQVDSMLAGVWVRDKTEPSKEFMREELLDFYNEHLKDFEFPSRAKWEQISVSKSGRTPQQAFNMLAELGNAVVRQRVPFAQVAKDRSEGPTATSGGAHNWTTQGSLVSEPLDRALFSLPVGEMSRIIEDDKSFHIIRVTERIMAGRTPFEEVQEQIRETLLEEQRNKNYTKYLAGLRETIPVASILDGTLEWRGQAASPTGLRSASATVGDGNRP
ncbi:MAG: peptidyl-prolyl cis-trans isomerase [Pirellulales bacterium]|nr:peptidyl-prolyl cis-trans isomerase [Pirellulales bacterium]